MKKKLKERVTTKQIKPKKRTVMNTMGAIEKEALRAARFLRFFTK